MPPSLLQHYVASTGRPLFERRIPVPPASKIKLYIPPHGMESPFEFVVYPPQPDPYKVTVQLSPLLSRLDALVRDLHQVSAAPGELAPVNIPAPQPPKWVLFCPARLTFVARSEAQRFLEVRAREYSEEVDYVVLPVATCFWRDILGLLQVAFPTQLAHVTVQAMRDCALTLIGEKSRPLDRAVARGKHAFCHHSQANGYKKPTLAAQFHLDGIRDPWRGASQYRDSEANEFGHYHVALWLPGIMLPFDLILPTQAHSGLPSALEGLISVTLVELKSKDPGDELAQSGYFPTAQNWMLVDFSSQTLLHKTSAADLHLTATSSQTYCVIPLQHSRLAKGMIDAVKRDGPQGWAIFWNEALDKKKRGTTQTPVHTSDTSAAAFKYGDAA